MPADRRQVSVSPSKTSKHLFRPLDARCGPGGRSWMDYSAASLRLGLLAANCYSAAPRAEPASRSLNRKKRLEGRSGDHPPMRREPLPRSEGEGGLAGKAVAVHLRLRQHGWRGAFCRGGRNKGRDRKEPRVDWLRRSGGGERTYPGDGG